MDADGCRVSVGAKEFVVREVGGHVRRTSRKYQSRQARAVDENGAPVMTWTGGHYGHVAGTNLTLSDAREFSLPVRKSGSSVLMSAIEVGTPERQIIGYRLTKGTTWLPVSMSLRQIYSVEVIVSQQALSIPDLALMVALTSHLPWFFNLVPG